VISETKFFAIVFQGNSRVTVAARTSGYRRIRSGVALSHRADARCIAHETSCTSYIYWRGKNDTRCCRSAM